MLIICKSQPERATLASVKTIFIINDNINDDAILFLTPAASLLPNFCAVIIENPPVSP